MANEKNNTNTGNVLRLADFRRKPRHKPAQSTVADTQLRTLAESGPFAKGPGTHTPSEQACVKKRTPIATRKRNSTVSHAFHGAEFDRRNKDAIDGIEKMRIVDGRIFVVMKLRERDSKKKRIPRPTDAWFTSLELNLFRPEPPWNLNVEIECVARDEVLYGSRYITLKTRPLGTNAIAPAILSDDSVRLLLYVPETWVHEEAVCSVPDLLEYEEFQT